MWLCVWANPNESCSCVERAIIEAEIKTGAEERRGEDGAEKCHRGETDRAQCPEGQQGGDAGLQLSGRVTERTGHRY